MEPLRQISEKWDYLPEYGLRTVQFHGKLGKTGIIWQNISSLGQHMKIVLISGKFSLDGLRTVQFHGKLAKTGIIWQNFSSLGQHIKIVLISGKFSLDGLQTVQFHGKLAKIIIIIIIFIEETFSLTRGFRKGPQRLILKTKISTLNLKKK